MSRDNHNKKSLFGWLRWFRFGFGRSYISLVAEKERLSKTVWHWQYPEGGFVPQDQRLRMFSRLRKLESQIARHPDNPARIRERLQGRKADDEYDDEE